MGNSEPRAAFEPLAAAQREVRESYDPTLRSSTIAQAIGADSDLLKPIGRAAETKTAPVASPIKTGPHYHGHRTRLRERFHDAGAAALSDYELLELVLFRALPRRDVKPLAKDLIARFGSFAEVVNAPDALLAKVPGVGKTTVIDIKLIAAAASRVAKGAIKARETLSSWSAVVDYCRTAMAFADKEQFRILFLDKRNQLIADEVQQTGTVDHTPVYPREVVKRALELSATAIILVHNHPSGDPTPSNADIQMTKQIVEIAGQLGISVHDHIIVGKNGHTSLKGLRLM